MPNFALQSFDSNFSLSNQISKNKQNITSCQELSHRQFYIQGAHQYYLEEYIGLRTNFAPNKHLIVQKNTVSTASTAYTIALQYYILLTLLVNTVYTAFTAKELLCLFLEYGYNFLLVYIPHIFPYWYTTTLFRPVKVHQQDQNGLDRSAS